MSALAILSRVEDTSTEKSCLLKIAHVRKYWMYAPSSLRGLGGSMRRAGR